MSFIVQYKSPHTNRWRKVEGTESHTYGLAMARGRKHIICHVKSDLSFDPGDLRAYFFNKSGLKKSWFNGLHGKEWAADQIRYRVYNVDSKESWPVDWV